MIKVFWWGELDELGGTQPYLHYIDDTGTVLLEYSDRRGRLNQLLANGYQEISRRTAYEMQLPV